LSGRLAELGAEIEKVKARLQARYSDAVADVLERHEDESRALASELTQAQQKAASPLGEAWGECHTLLDALEAAPNAEEAHLRLWSVLRRIVEGIWCLFVVPGGRKRPGRKATERGNRRLAAVQVHFTGGKRRDYLILRQGATGGSVGARSAQSRVWSLSDV